jgi:hypothetical protein
MFGRAQQRPREATHVALPPVFAERAMVEFSYGEWRTPLVNLENCYIVPFTWLTRWWSESYSCRMLSLCSGWGLVGMD